MSEHRVKITDKLLESLDGVKDDLSSIWKLEIREAVEDLADLLLEKLGNQDPQVQASLDREILHARARIANWSFVGADLVRASIKKALHELAELAGSVLKGFID